MRYFCAFFLSIQDFPIYQLPNIPLRKLIHAVNKTYAIYIYPRLFQPPHKPCTFPKYGYVVSDNNKA